jgi:MoaA/NifB/PqqE/SkfB family radical SAM enzyme
MAVIKPFTGVDDRVKLADVIPLRTPFTLNIFPTNACNFKCGYCAQSLGAKRLIRDFGIRTESMSMETLTEITAQAKCFPDRFKLVSMMGHGEPLMNRRLPEMVSLIKKADIAERVDVITNASLLDKEYGRSLVAAGIDVIRISLQGITARKYKEISGINLDFEEFIENLTFLYRNKGQCKVYVKTMDVCLDEGEEERFYRLFGGITDRMYIDKVKPVYDGVAYDEGVDEVTMDRYGNRHEQRKVCPQPFYMLSIWPNGDGASCEAIYKAGPLGNVAATSLTEMWSSNILRQFRIMQLKGLRSGHPACRRCCAPDDVIHPLDVLDGYEKELLARFGSRPVPA